LPAITSGIVAPAAVAVSKAAKEATNSRLCAAQAGGNKRALSASQDSENAKSVCRPASGQQQQAATRLPRIVAAESKRSRPAANGLETALRANRKRKNGNE
jgi:hypothetical protein